MASGGISPDNPASKMVDDLQIDTEHSKSNCKQCDPEDDLESGDCFGFPEPDPQAGTSQHLVVVKDGASSSACTSSNAASSSDATCVGECKTRVPTDKDADKVNPATTETSNVANPPLVDPKENKCTQIKIWKGKQIVKMLPGTSPVQESASKLQEQSSTALTESSLDESEKMGTSGTPPSSDLVETPTLETESCKSFNYMENRQYATQILTLVLPYLNLVYVMELEKVSRLWADVVHESSYFNNISMRYITIYDWKKYTDILIEHNTRYLDLRHMPTPRNDEFMWYHFLTDIPRVTSLIGLKMCRCPAWVIEELLRTNKNLQRLEAVHLNIKQLNTQDLSSMNNLHVLRLKSVDRYTLYRGTMDFDQLIHLRELELTSVLDLHNYDIKIFSKFQNLQCLALGDCSNFPEDFGSMVIAKLQKLHKLRLEKWDGVANINQLLTDIQHMSQLNCLELINVDVNPGFEQALGSCNNLRKLLIIPNNVYQVAMSNNLLLQAVLKLKPTLAVLHWGITLETLLAIDAILQGFETKGVTEPVRCIERIPVMRPVPLYEVNDDQAWRRGLLNAELIPILLVQSLLRMQMPTTKVKLLTIPYNRTWRQNIANL